MQNKNMSERIRRMVAIAVFAALAYVSVALLRIPVMFLTFDFKDVIVTVCGLFYGPMAAFTLAIIVPLLEFITISDTGVYGLIMNFLSTAAFSITASLIYKFKKTLGGALIGLISGIFAMTAVMMLANLLVTPYYMGVPTATVAALIPKLLLPFNLIKAVLNAAIVLLLYKPISRILRRSGMLDSSSENVVKNTNSKTRSIVVTVIALAIIAASFAIIFFVLKS